MPSSGRLMSAGRFNTTHFPTMRLSREHGSKLHTHTKRRVLGKTTDISISIPRSGLKLAQQVLSASSWPVLGKINMRAPPRNPRVLTYTATKVHYTETCFVMAALLHWPIMGSPHGSSSPHPNLLHQPPHMRSLCKGKKMGCCRISGFWRWTNSPCLE